NNLVESELKKKLLQSGTGDYGSRKDRRFLQSEQIDGIETNLRPVSREAFEFLKEVIAESRGESLSGQINVCYLPGEYEISEFTNDENIEEAGIEVDCETKNLTDDE